MFKHGCNQDYLSASDIIEKNNPFTKADLFYLLNSASLEIVVGIYCIHNTLSVLTKTMWNTYKC